MTEQEVFVLADRTLNDVVATADLVRGLWDELSPVANEWRELGAFPPRVAVPDDAPLQHRLLGLTGRALHAA